MPKTGAQPETRSIEQYKVHTLHTNVVKVLGKKDGKEVTRTDRVPVAVFTDLKALETYQSKSVTPKGFEGYEVVEDWVTEMPKAEHFSLPLNPAPNAPASDAEAADDAKDNGTN